MSNFRVKGVKFGRPVCTRDRLPTSEDTNERGFVLVWSHYRLKWELHSVEAPKWWPTSYPFWRRALT